MEIKKVGMRNIKTGIGVGVSILAGNIGVIENPFFTAAASLSAIKSTVKGSVETGWHRIIGTILGGIFGFVFGHFYNDGALMASLGVCMIIYICNILKINNSINMSLLTFLSIILSLDDSTNILNYSIVRTWDTSIGVIIGLSVNYSIQRSRYFKIIARDMIKTKREFFDMVEVMIAENKSIDLSIAEEKVNKISSLYEKLVLEVEYSRKNMELDEYERSLEICKNINLHLNAINLIDDDVTITPENYNEIKRMWPKTVVAMDVVNDDHPVFNYHISMIIEELKRDKKK